MTVEVIVGVLVLLDGVLIIVVVLVLEFAVVVVAGAGRTQKLE